MKTAIFSDIHANPAALRKAINSARRLGCEKFICCGDIVGYGYDPNGCIDICRKYGMECVKGNHDAALVGELSIEWFSETAARQILTNRPLVTEDNKEWLRSLPYTIEKQFAETKVVFSHGTYFEPKMFGYIESPIDAKIELRTLKANGIHALFVGHTHLAAEAMLSKYDPASDANIIYGTGPRSRRERWACRRDGWSTAIFNVGSVGYPRRSRFSTYAILDDDTFTVEWRRLPFDLIGYRDGLLAKGMQIPVWLSGRISFMLNGGNAEE